MNKILYYILISFFFLAEITIASPSKKNLKNVLVIHSYHQQFNWTNQINKAISDKLSNSDIVNEIFVEYIDAKRHNSKLIYSKLLSLFVTKYNNDNISVIVTSDNVALEFATILREQLNKNLPIVFCGVNDIANIEPLLQKNITGVAELNEPLANLDLAIKLFPRTTDVAIITDTTTTSSLLYSGFINKFRSKYPTLKFSKLVNLPSKQLIIEVNNLPKTTIGLVLGYFFDEDGTYEDYTFRLPELTERTSIPFLAVWGFYSKLGIIGGKLTDGFNQGKKASQIVINILKGTSINDIPIIKENTNSWIFNYDKLKQFNIKEKDLPSESIIINKPSSNVLLSKTVIGLISFIGSLLLVALLFLISVIVKKRKVEAQLVSAKQKAEKADKLKSDFLAQMSHEIRTPINTILSYSNYIKSEIENELNNDLHDCFNSITNGGKRLIRTIDSILKVSEIQSDVVEVNKIPTNIYRDIIFPLIKEFELVAKNKGLVLTSNNKAKYSEVNVDRYLLRQAIANLIDNAIKYTETGSVKVELKNSSTNNLLVKITDTGIGIDEEFQEKLFEPFSQELQGYSRKYEGNGLGLTLVKKYCELNDAHISFTSKKGEGTTFSIQFN